MGPTLTGLRRSAARPGESHAKGSARPTASGSRVRPSVAERSRTLPSPRPPEPRLPPLLSESARALPDRLIGPRPRLGVKSRKAALSGPFEIRGENGRRDASGAGPRGCRDRGGLGGRSRSKMAAARRGKGRGAVPRGSGGSRAELGEGSRAGVEAVPGKGSVWFGSRWNWTAEQPGRWSSRLFGSPAAPRGPAALAPGPCAALVLRRAVPVPAPPSLLTAEQCSVACTGRALVLLPPVGVSTLGVTGAAGNTGVQVCGLGPALCVTCGGARRPCGSTLALGPGSRARGAGACFTVWLC